MPRVSLSLAAAVLATAAGSVSGLWAEHTFTPPFKSFNNDGMRQIEGWRIGGTAELNENFLRLTPDRQSKRGYVWNNNRIEPDRSEFWSATVRFRTSGNGKRLFGDGIAFWATNHASHRDGSLHGFTDTFRGFGIVLDTFVNNEPGHVHKDIQIVSSDGSAPRKLDDKPIGCDADFRYWEGRDDFSVANHSAIRVRYAGGRVSVWVDARGNGQWSSCIQDAALAAPSGWNRDGLWVGMTASTGDLADNHDVLSVQIGAEDEPAPVPAGLNGAVSTLPVFVPTGDGRVDEAILSAAAREGAMAAERLTFVQHTLEHQLSSIQDSIKIALKKLAEREDESQKRLDELEKKIRDKIESQVQAKVEGKLDDGIASRLAKLEGMVASAVKSGVESKINDVLPDLHKDISSSLSSSLKSDINKDIDSKVAAAAAESGGSGASNTILYAFMLVFGVAICVMACFNDAMMREIGGRGMLPAWCTRCCRSSRKAGYLD